MGETEAYTITISITNNIFTYDSGLVPAPMPPVPPKNGGLRSGKCGLKALEDECENIEEEGWDKSVADEAAPVVELLVMVPLP